MNFHQIFPTVIGQVSCNIENFDKDTNNLLNCELEYHKEYNFIVSKNKNILELAPNLKSYILDNIHEYARTALNLNKKIRITQSWITKQTSESKIFQHRHQNSIISGTFYLNMDHNQSGITFFKDNDLREKYIDWVEDTNTNNFTYGNITFQCQTGALILFPSYLRHSVSQDKNNENRFSLAFNTWFDEPIGMWENLNYLDVQ